MKYKAVLFDFDDTLGDRERYAGALYRDIVVREGYAVDAPETEAIIQQCMIWDQNGSVSKHAIEKELRETYGFRFDGIDDLDTYWDDHLWEYTVLFDDALPVLRELKEEGYLPGAVTNGKTYGQMQKIRQSGIEDMLDVIAVSEAVGFRKPDRGIFDWAADRLHVRNEECIFIGDNWTTDIIGALHAGMKPVWYWPHGERVCHYPVERISCLSELPALVRKLEGEKE